MRDHETHESTIELFKESMKFSAGHFTIFSAAQRERLHGHNFTVHCALTARVDENGMFADYRRYKETLHRMCAAWNEYFLLPGESPHLRIEYVGERIEAHFGDEVIPFLARDVQVLPVRNVILEELARLMAHNLVADPALTARERLSRVVIKVSSGPGQSASYTWEAS